MAGITVECLTDNKKIKDLEKILDCLTYKSLDVSLDISMGKIEIDRYGDFASFCDKSRARLLEAQTKVRDLLREERKLEAQIERVKERIRAEAAKDRQQSQQVAETEN